MKVLKSLQSIEVPPPQPERTYEIELHGRTYQFKGLKRLLACADHSKAGERNARLAAKDGAEREAARSCLSQLTLRHLFENPLTDAEGNIDSVMRVNYDIDSEKFNTISDWTLSEFKNELLKRTGAEIQPLSSAITGVMAAAVAKLCDTHELVYIPSKIETITQARTTLGRRGTLSSRLQPNHPTDDLRSVTLLSYLGWSLGGGDCLMGINPAEDTISNISSLLEQLNHIRTKHNVPTQICVLSHIKTQLQCLRNGAPVEIMFQSLAGTEATNLSEFDISIEVLDEAYQAMAELGPLRKEGAKQFMYFETGQGSEFTYAKHNDTDMATLEALCYGLARRYDPFMVNNVTGFIGPETHADNYEMITSSLQDHFMGKLLGLPMGMAPCYTLHSGIDLEGQQMATQMLTAAGSNYYMDVYLNVDRMLAYFDTSAHDNQTLREIYSKEPNSDYLQWAVERGIFEQSNGRVERGPNWGNPRIFCESEAEFQELLDSTPSLYKLDNAGPRPVDQGTRELRADQAIARQAVHTPLNLDQLRSTFDFQILNTKAKTREEHLNSPDLGAFLSDESIAKIQADAPNIQVIVSDGLSAEAVHYNVPQLLPVLTTGLERHGYKLGRHALCEFGRVKLADEIARITLCDLALLLIGERPGGTAASSRSLSCYFVYPLKEDETKNKAARFSGNPNIQTEYSVLCNIYSDGTPPEEAASVIVDTAHKILTHKAAGNRLIDSEPNC